MRLRGERDRRELRDPSYVLKEVTATPTRPTKVRRLLQRPASLPRVYTSEQALALFVDTHHTKAMCHLTWISAKEQGVNVYHYPPYREMVAGKGKCCPDGISLLPSRAEVPLQSLLSHTAHRVVSLQENVVRQVAGERQDTTVQLACEWGLGIRQRQRGAAATSNMLREVLSLLEVDISGDVSDASDSDASE